MRYYEQKSANNWLNEPNKPKELNKLNMDYLYEYKQCKEELTQLSVVAYFFMTYVPDMKESMNTIFRSIKRQRTFVSAMILNLKKYGVEKKWEVVLKKDAEKIHERYRYLIKIMDENLRLTEYYLYFKNSGWDLVKKLSEERTKICKDLDEYEKIIYSAMIRYNKEHKDEVKKHVEEVKAEKERLEARREKIKQAEMSEKKAKRDAKKAENDEIKEMKANAIKHKKEYEKLEKTFERYYTKQA